MKLHPTIAELVSEIDAFVERSGMTRTDFGLKTVGDPNLYRRLSKGSNPRLATMDRIRAFLRKRESAA